MRQSPRAIRAIRETRRQRGLTLVELMIGLFVGMLVIGAVLYVFLGSRLTYKYNETLGRMQENGRVTIEMVGHDLRMAGFIGCRRLAAYLPPPYATGSAADERIHFSTDFIDKVKTSLGLSEFDTLDLAKNGFVFSRELPDQVSGTDSLVALSGSSEIRLAALMSSGSGDILTTETVPAGPAIISDCRLDKLSLSETTSTGLPASAEAFWVETAGSTITGNNFVRAYGTDASITPISAISYSIRETGRIDGRGNAVLALFRNDDELIEGARDLCVRYGIAANSSNEAVGEYLRKKQIDEKTDWKEDDWKKVIAIRVELLLASVDDNTVDLEQSAMPQSAIPFCDGDFTPGDRRMYKVFSTTAGLRNQVRQP